jgi:hypothetical protein
MMMKFMMRCMTKTNAKANVKAEALASLTWRIRRWAWGCQLHALGWTAHPIIMHYYKVQGWCKAC